MRKIFTTGMALSLIFAARACKQTREGADLEDIRRISAPVIEIAPLGQGVGQWKIVAPDAASNAVTVTVTAPGAERIRILGRPEGVEEDYLELRTLAAPVDRSAGSFVTRLNLTPDFAGEVWAEAVYRDGSKKRTGTILLAVDEADDRTFAQLDVVGGSVGTDESARSDKLTGGRIVRAKLIAGEPDVRITVNAPAFQLTLWQNGKEISSYRIGIGHKDFSLPVGERQAAEIVFNPQWIPSGDAWAARGDGAPPDRKIKPNDPSARLSRIKIPLGAGCMIREAAKADDIGRAVSRGCILMLGHDLVDLAEKLAAARNLPVTKSKGAWLRSGGVRIAAKFDPPVLVDINYDLYVVENRVLRVYPDVYDRGAFALDSLRAELQGAGVATSRLGDQSLQRILDQVGDDSQFVINVADVGRGRLRRGRNLPLVSRSAENEREIAALKR
ncbi:MAG TPA: L,D-transpeptidase family protein [Blastocatellia bacterium]